MVLVMSLVLQQNIAQETVENMTVLLALILLEAQKNALFALLEHIAPVELKETVEVIKSVLLASRLAALVHLVTSVRIRNLKARKDAYLELILTEQTVKTVKPEIIVPHRVVVVSRATQEHILKQRRRLALLLSLDLKQKALNQQNV